MRQSRTAPPGARKRTCIPTTDHARPSSSRPGEGPAPSRAPEALPSAALPAAREPPEPTGSTPSPLFPPPSWLSALRAHIDDGMAAGLDATAPPGERDLGRRMARQHIVEARRAIDALFALVEGPP
jgi:hypothetical protein